MQTKSKWLLIFATVGLLPVVLIAFTPVWGWPAYVPALLAGAAWLFHVFGLGVTARATETDYDADYDHNDY